MKYFKYGIFIPCVLFLVSCVTPPAPVAPVSSVPPVERDYETKRDNDKDRDAVLKRAKDRSKGKTCKGDDDCEDICKDIYTSRRDKNKCEEYSVSQVEEFETLYAVLKDPDFDDLEEINLDALDTFLNINIKPFDKLVKKYNKKDAKNVLTWISTNDDVATLLEKEDDDYGILSNLFKDLTLPATFTPFTAVAMRIDGGDSFMDIAIINGNEPAFNLVSDYLEEKACSGNIDTLVCFKLYCNLGKAIDKDNDLLGFEDFEEYLNDIIGALEPVNGDTTQPIDLTKWNADSDATGYIEEVDDLEGDWWKTPALGGLCIYE